MYGSLVAGNGGGNGNGDDWGPLGVPPDAEYITAIIGESVVFNCHVEFPDNYPVPYIVQWDKKVRIYKQNDHYDQTFSLIGILLNQNWKFEK